METELLEERHVWRFKAPDGSIGETDWKGIDTASLAQALANITGSTLIGELRPESTLPLEPVLTPKPNPPKSTPIPEPPRRPPPKKLVPAGEKKAPRPPPSGITPKERGIDGSRPTAKDRIGGSPPPAQPPTVPVLPQVKHIPSGRTYDAEDFLDVTMTQSFPIISTGFNIGADVAHYLSVIFPPLEGVAKVYRGIAEIADAGSVLYELCHEMSQAEALEKGGKEVVKRTHPARLVAEKILKSKYPKIPEQFRKEIAKRLEDLFERYVSDPAIKKGRQKMEKMDEDKELQRSLFEDLKSIQKTIQDSVLLKTGGAEAPGESTR